MKYIKMLLLTLSISITCFSIDTFAAWDYDVSGTYYDDMYKFDQNDQPDHNASQLTTHGTAYLYATKGKKWRMWIEGSREESVYNHQYMTVTSTGEVRHWSTGGTGGYFQWYHTYDDHYGWSDKYDGKPMTIYCLYGHRNDLDAYARRHTISLDRLLQLCPPRVTVYVRQNPATCSRTPRCHKETTSFL